MILDHLINYYDYRTVIASLLCILIGYYILRQWFHSSGLPRGPWGIPFLGYIPFLSNEVHMDFIRLGKKYGDVFSVSLGNRLTIILNSYEAIKEAYVKDGDVFSGKPNDGIEAEFGGFKSIFVTEGEVWKEQRRFLLSTMRDFGFGKTRMEKYIKEEAQCAIEELRKSAGQPMEMHDVLRAMSCNIISFLTFAKRFDYQDKVLENVMKALDVGSNISLVIYFLLEAVPRMVLKCIPEKISNARKFDRVVTTLYDFIDKMIEEHETTFDENNIRDVIDVYLLKFHQMKKNGQTPDGTIYTKAHMRVNVIFLFGAGTDTTATTMCWALKLIAAHPQVQDRLHEELDRIVGRERAPTMNDRTKLTYFEATLLEIHRFATILPLTFMHRTTEETNLRGYRIPKHSFSMSNQWSVHYNPEIWKDPENFRPDRFLEKDGSISKLRDYVIPFSIGKRNCLGESLARMELVLFLSSLLQKFKFMPPEGEKLHLTKKTGNFNRLESCKLRPIPRN